MIRDDVPIAAAPRLAADWIWSNFNVKTIHISVISAAAH